ncbi:autotransporter assembly complex protein TamA [Rhodalgimonas zhirmunskyi]|uniref:Autotransporter assembly complex protein TamA n=1 Tax=Rhodalgimonas zhirmunskyi TaxID=2964767 RepID=A0AAJ1U8T9_9RHOB|nr:autotransporter assembly complex family protein [Rhodoalgimonas zhirmunskyi]MDQ2095725.1 autotransporter assembly complex protein TamA [Rhodoalgimonas zhirmunskyi]
MSSVPKRLVLAGAFLSVFNILPGEAEVRQTLVVEAGGKDLKSSIEGALTTRTLISDGDETSQSLIAAAQADYARIVAVLYDAGYFGPSVSIKLDGVEAAQISPFASDGSVGKVEVTVTPGKQFRFGRATIAPLAQGTTLPEGYRAGATAGTAVIREAATSAVSGWRDVGHAKAAVSGQKITANHPAAEVNSDIQLAPGPRLRFGQLIVSGEERMRADRIRAIAGLPTGKVFDPDDLDDATRRLQTARVFQVVSLSEADQPNPDGTLDITAAVVERKLRRFGFGAEYGTLDGGTLSAFWLHRNLFGGAERLRIEGEVSNIAQNGGGIDYELSARFDRPASWGADTDFYLTATLEHVDDPLYLTDQAEVEAGFKRIVSDQLTLQAGVGLTYSDTTDAYGSRTFLVATLPLEATYDKRDNKLNPTKGYYLNAELTPFFGISGGDGSGARLYTDARAYRALGKAERMVIAARLQLGSIMGSSPGETLPDMLFYSGGGGTVRGHAYQSLGVTLPSGLEVGGENFIGLSLELRGKITDKAQLVGFTDYGFVGAGAMPGQDGEWQSGAGLGLRYDTGIGPLRLDVATPTSGPNAGERAEVYIGIGQAF